MSRYPVYDRYPGLARYLGVDLYPSLFQDLRLWAGASCRILPCNATTVLVLRFWYISLFWAFQFSFHLKYSWVFVGPQGFTERPVSPEEMEYYRVKEQLHLWWWGQYGLLLLLGCWGSVLTIGMLASLVVTLITG